MPVTVVIPVRNEERNLPRCLERLSRFAKIVVIDSGSTDRTREISESLGAEVVDFKWDGHYPKKRNWLLINRPPSTPWVFFLDADEYVSQEFVDELERVLPTTTSVGFRVRYTNHFMGRALRFGVVQRKLPLFRVGAGLYERIDEDNWSHLDMEVHEHPILDGAVGELKALIDHQDFKGIEAHEKRHEQYAQWEARRYLRLMESQENKTHLTSIQKVKYQALTSWWLAPAYFAYIYLAKLGCLDGAAGLAHARSKARYFARIRRNISELRQCPKQP